MRTHFWKNLRHIKMFLLFWLFLSEIMLRRSRLSRTTSDPAQKVENLRPKLRRFIFCFSGGENFSTTICHAVLDFREHQGPPSDLFNHARLIAIENQNKRWRIPGFWPISFLNIAKTNILRGSLFLIYTPKEAHGRIFVTKESFFARKMLVKNSFSWGGKLVHWRRLHSKR